MDLHQTKNTRNLSFLVQKFLANHKIAPSTRRLYAVHLSNFVACMPENIDDIKLEMIESHLIKFENKLSGSTISSYTGMIKAFFRWWGDCGGNDLGRKLLRKDFIQADPRCLTHEEYEKILAAKIPPAYLDIFIILCNTGLRQSEFLPLTAKNIVGDFLRIVGAKRGRRNRSIPLNKAAKEILGRDDQLLFIQGTVKSWLHWVCLKIAEEADIETFHPHSCRHYFATELHNKGVPITTISRLLGHQNSATTEMVYIHWSEESLKGATDILD